MSRETIYFFLLPCYKQILFLVTKLQLLEYFLKEVQISQLLSLWFIFLLCKYTFEGVTQIYFSRFLVSVMYFYYTHSFRQFSPLEHSSSQCFPHFFHCSNFCVCDLCLCIFQKKEKYMPWRYFDCLTFDHSACRGSIKSIIKIKIKLKNLIKNKLTIW